jgi:hypothetical protein
MRLCDLRCTDTHSCWEKNVAERGKVLGVLKMNRYNIPAVMVPTIPPYYWSHQACAIAQGVEGLRRIVRGCDSPFSKRCRYACLQAGGESFVGSVTVEATQLEIEEMEART